MSKIAKAINYEVHGLDYRSEPVKLDYTKINFESETISGHVERITKYKLRVTIETSAYVTEYQDSAIMIKAVKRAMIEEIFGEFRPLIYKLNAVLYSRDLKEAEKIVTELDHLMFNEGL